MNELKPYLRYVRIIDIDPQDTKPHTMAYDARFFYVLGGSVSFNINGENFKLYKGDAVIISPAVKYAFSNPSDNKANIFAINFDFSFDLNEQEIPIPPDKPENFDISKAIIAKQQLFSDYNVFRGLNNEDLLYKIIFEYNSKLLGYKNVCSGLFLAVLVNCQRALFNTPNKTVELNQKHVKAFIDFIQKNYYKDITNASMSKVFHFHPNYINYIMKKYTGFSLHQYLLRLRIDKAIKLLETSSMSISEIALKLGFKDTSYFSRYFKKVTGKRPSKFR